MKVMTLNGGNRGSYDCHTPTSSIRYLLPSVYERRQQIVNELAELNRKSNAVYEQLGCPNKVNIRKYRDKVYQQTRHNPILLKEYLDYCKRIHDLNIQLEQMNNKFKNQIEETIDSMFVRAARNLLNDGEFNRILNYARVMMNELHEQVYLEEEVERPK